MAPSGLTRLQTTVSFRITVGVIFLICSSAFTVDLFQVPPSIVLAQILVIVIWQVVPSGLIHLQTTVSSKITTEVKFPICSSNSTADNLVQALWTQDSFLQTFLLLILTFPLIFPGPQDSLHILRQKLVRIGEPKKPFGTNTGVISFVHSLKS